MALIYPQGMYSEGQVQFDAMPYVKAIEAKKKAKDEAFTKYYDNLKTQINTAGVRNQDIVDPVTGKGINEDIQNWTRYGIENRKEIAKGGLAKLKFEEGQRKLLNQIQRSKNALNLDTKLGELKFTGKYDPDPDDLKKQESLARSIYDPQHLKEDGTEWGLGDFSPSVEPLSISEKNALNQYITKGVTPVIDVSIKPIKIGNQNKFVTKYSPETIKNSADKLMSQFPEKAINQDQKRLIKTFSPLLENEDFMVKASPVFESIYGREIETPGDAAAAQLIIDMKGYTKEKYQNIPRPRAAKGGSGGGGDEKIDESLYYISDEIATNQGKLTEIIDEKGKNIGKKYVIPVRDIDPERLNTILGTDINKGIAPVPPIKFKWTNPDGTKETIDVYYADPKTMDWMGANQQKISREGAKDRYIKVAAPTKQRAKTGTKGSENTLKDNPLGI